ncbi:MAG: DNA polymerase III subunit delta [Actinomycetota bacterium]
MKPVALITGPREVGPGERQEMLDRARAFLEGAGIARGTAVRIDVPGRGGGEEGDGPIRPELEPVIPMLQSGSLFGDRQGLNLVEAQNLNVAEATLLAELIAQFDPEAVAVVLVTFGSLPNVLAKVVKMEGQTFTVSKMWERQATDWLKGELATRGLTLDGEAVDALLQRFGTDIAGLGQALDQLVEQKGRITRSLILDRFRNRPDEPTFHYIDAVSAGKTGEALRRLADFLTHGHPLVLLAAIENDLRRRSLAAVAGDEDSFRKAIGARSDDRRASRVWRDRGKVSDSSLQKALEALVRADRVMKSQPEEVHRVTLERLTVALSRWYGGKRR